MRQRYSFSTSLRYRVVQRGRVVLAGTGRTLNMHSGGALVELDAAVQAGDRLELSVDWVGLYHGTERCQLMVRGRVVRCEGRQAVVSIQESEFRTSGASAERGRAVA